MSAKAPDFTDVMAELRGLKLAVYDLLIRGGILSTTTIAATLRKEGTPEEITAVLEWLRRHHFIRPVGDGTPRWEPRSRAYAEGKYLSRGVLAPDANLGVVGPPGVNSSDKASARPDTLNAGTAQGEPVHHPRPAVHVQQSTWW